MNPFFAGYYTNITVSSCNTKRISSREKSLGEKYVHIPGCQKNGAFHIGIQKNRAIHILFVEKRGPIIYLAVLKNGAIRHAHPYYAIYRKLHPHPEIGLALSDDRKDHFFFHISITKTRLFKYIYRNLHLQKLKIFR